MAVNQYFKDTAAEMRHVTWPTKKQAALFTLLVIGISVILAIYLGLLDAFFLRLLNLIIER